MPADLSGCAEVPWVQEGHHVQGQDAGQRRGEVQPGDWKRLHQQIPAAPEGFGSESRTKQVALREGRESGDTPELGGGAAAEQRGHQAFPLPVGPQVEPAEHQVHPVLKQLEHAKRNTDGELQCFKSE